MQNHIIFLPMLAHMFLTFLLFGLLNSVKNRSKKAGTVDLQRRALFADAWPADVIKVNNCIKNQFELPMLFYGLSLILWATNFVNVITLSLAIIFVFTRYIHAYIHTGSNVVKRRALVYKIGAVALVLLFSAALWATVKASF